MLSDLALPWREAVRAVVLDPADRILLVQFDFGVWAGPGGGLEHGEDHETALRRELAEEAGFDGIDVGPWLWTRAHAFPDMPGYCGQRERIYLVRVAAVDPLPRIDLAAEHVIALRWWTLEELASSSAEFAPRRLPALVGALLDDGPPPTPIDVGV